MRIVRTRRFKARITHRLGYRAFMKVTHGQIISRGLANRCPNCGGNRLFKDGTLFQLNDGCPDCGLKFEKDEGFFLGAMSQRAAKNLQDDMQGLGPLRLKEVDEAQMKMVTLAKDLAEKGEIIISKGNAEDELVY